MPPSPIKHRAAKSWHKITIQSDPRMTEAVTAYLSGLTGAGLEISSLESDQMNASHTFAPEKITAYIPIGPKESNMQAAAHKIEALKLFLAKTCLVFPDCSEPILDTEIIMEEDWGEKWKDFFTSFKITPTLLIKPSWEDANKLAREELSYKAVIEMDPGLAFGTGHHASTQLALLLLEDLFQQRGPELGKILDIGTGSGILAMACGLYGAKEILALDNDPDAVATAQQNIIRNHLEGKIKVSSQEVSAVKPGFDLVVANITHDTLADLAKLLPSLIAPGGYLVLSGILKGDQEHSIGKIYAKQDFIFNKSLAKDEWAALQFQKH